MKITTGATHVDNKFEKALFVAQPKEGKSAFLVASSLGVFPGQTLGGIVDSPANLHVVAFDMGAMDGMGRFLTQTCSAPLEALQFNIYNMEADLQTAMTCQTDYDRTLFEELSKTIQLIGSKSRTGTHVVIISSLTLYAQAMQRAIGGPLRGKGGNGMDQNKWSMLNYVMNESRNLVQSGPWHTIWESHIYKTPGRGPQDPPEESLAISGQTGQNFASNVLHTYRIRRMAGSKIANTKCDQVNIDTRPTGGFMSNGRGTNERLDPQEKDLTNVFSKLGFQVGNWGQKDVKSAIPTRVAVVK